MPVEKIEHSADVRRRFECRTAMSGVFDEIERYALRACGLLKRRGECDALFDGDQNVLRSVLDEERRRVGLNVRFGARLANEFGVVADRCAPI
nr:hypothetical protein [Paenibacillus rhizovicinus]